MRAANWLNVCARAVSPHARLAISGLPSPYYRGVAGGQFGSCGVVVSVQLVVPVREPFVEEPAVPSEELAPVSSLLLIDEHPAMHTAKTPARMELASL